MSESEATSNANAAEPTKKAPDSHKKKPTAEKKDDKSTVGGDKWMDFYINAFGNHDKVLQKLAEIVPSDNAAAAKLEWGRHWIEAGFRALEMVLSTCSAQYCFGETVTMADCCLVPQVYNANRFNVPIEEFPNISRVHAHLTLLPQFKAAHPNLQPDCPDEFKGK